ncbi:glycoside hydrolase family 26 protein [Spirillospora sp. CA-294931]|uniref:glycoside hydrolase family 26 protein n=1 Tax=Spirillospora sp. CA-294931 TaxID=3240042 RepID=UPI003D8A8C16
MVKARAKVLPQVALAVLVVAAAGCSSGAGAAPKIKTTARAGVAPTPPKQGAYFGAWLGESEAPESKPTASPGPSADGETSPSASPGGDVVAPFEKDLGRRLDIVQRYVGWQSKFPDEGDSGAMKDGRYLLLTWAGADTKEIVGGKHDEVIKERARAIKEAGRPIFLRWQRDMDKPGLQDKRIHSAADFIAAWKHIRGIFTAEKVDNVAWVWCPTAGGFGSRGAPAYYPGDDQVDWICSDAQPGGDYDYRDLSETLKLFIEWARDRPKPLMIAELGVPQAYGARRAEWLRKAAKTLQDPQIKAVVYFNSNEQAEEPRDKRRMYSVTGDKRAVSALREMATTPFFNPQNLPVTSGG